MKKNQPTSDKPPLKLNRDTLRTLSREQMEQANGGTTLHTSTCKITWIFCA